MSNERIDELEIKPSDLVNSIFINGPGEFLVYAMVHEIRKVPQWARLFGCSEGDPGFIDSYKRMDYPLRGLPALRMYNEIYDKQFESWWVEGDVIADLILPASLRREELQQFQDSISAALLQQFRRTKYFNAVKVHVPGLNEMGKRFSVDKSLGFQSDDSDDIAPLTQIRINFRIDLRQWDLYLEKHNRTVDDPFEVTLADLETIVTSIEGLRDNTDESPEVIIEAETKTDS